MKPETTKLVIIALGLDAATTPEAAEAALTTHLKKIADDKAAEDDPNKEKPPGEKPNPPPAPAANEKILSDLTAAVAAANERTTALRETQADIVLDSVIDRGLITPADRATERATLLAAANEAEFNAKITELRGRRPVMQMRPLHARHLAPDAKQILAANEATDRANQRAEAARKAALEISGGRPPTADEEARGWNLAASRNATLFAH